MPQSLHVLTAHIVFSTKNREPCLTGRTRPQLHAYLAGILRRMECQSVTVGGVADHVHILCNMTKKHAPLRVVQMVKQESSKWLKTQADSLSGFHWQDGYGMFSVSPSHANAVKEYVVRQEEHHRRTTFREEVVRMLDRCGVEYDERYLWR